MSAFSNRQSIKDINDQINDASSGDTILASLDAEIATLSSPDKGQQGQAFLDKSLKDSKDDVAAMKRRALGARNSLTKSIKTDPVPDSNASLARDWMTASRADEEAESAATVQALSDKIAKQAAALLTADTSLDERFLRIGSLDNASKLIQDPDSIRTDAERIEDTQFLSGSGADIEDRIDPKITETTPATTSLMSRPYDADRMKDINESPVFKNYKYNLTNSTSTDNDVKNVQGMLTELGYKAGKADNVSGPGTERALRKFQAINGLTINGKLDDETMAKLKSSDVPLAFPDPPKKDAIVTELLDTDLEIFNTEVGKIESGNAYTYYKYDTPDGKYKKGDLMYGGAGGAYLGRYQMGTAALKDSGYNTAKKHYNMTKAQKDAFIKDPDLQDAEFKKYTKKNHIHLTKNSQAYRDMTKEEKLGILGYAHNQGATAAEEYLVTGVSGSDAFGTKGTKYTDALRVAFAEQVRTQSKAQ